MRQRSLTVGSGSTDRHLVEQIRTEDMGVVDITVICVLRLDCREIGIDVRRSEGHQLIGRPVNVSVNPIFSTVELVIDAGVPLNSVPGERRFERPSLSQRKIAGYRPDPCAYKIAPRARRRLA